MAREGGRGKERREVSEIAKRERGGGEQRGEREERENSNKITIASNYNSFKL